MSTVTLGELCSFVNGGAWSDSDYCHTGIPVLKVSNCKNSGFSLSEISYLSHDLREKYKQNKLQIDDIIIATVGSHPQMVESAAGRSCIVTHEVVGYYLNQNAVCIRTVNPSVLDQKYLFYLSKTKKFMHYIQNRGKGAANQMRIAIGAIKDYTLELPRIVEQRRIVAILSAYDGLIENNQKQIKLLEEAAQRLYKEWFVDLRFPGWEKTKIVDGVPEGWERLPLPQIADIQYGFAFDGSLFNSSGYGTPIVRIRNIPDAETSDFTSEEASSEYLINNGDIIVGMDGEFHINSWAGGQAYLVQRTCCIRPKIEKMRGWLLYSIHEPIKYFEKTIVGATVAHLGKKHLDSITLLLPTEELYAPFISIFDKRQILMEENIKLREVRDRLIYMLMSTN